MFVRNAGNHLSAIQKAALSLDAKAVLDVTVMIVELSSHSKVQLLPRYTIDSSFTGWAPIPPMIQLTTKLEFKAWAESKNIRVPETGTLQNALVKPNRGSYGEGIRGPFKQIDTATLNTGEFTEQFVDGSCFKCWFFGAVPVALEKPNRSRVFGNGRNTIRELIQSYYPYVQETSYVTRLKPYLEYQNLNLDSVLAEGQFAYVAYAYLTRFRHASAQNENQLASNTEMLGVLNNVGAELVNDFSSLKQSLYTVDGMVSDDGTVYFLEFNSNPEVHPDSYQTMIASLLGPKPNLPPIILVN